MLNPQKIVYMGMGLDLGTVQKFRECPEVIAIDPLIAYDWVCNSPMTKAFAWLSELFKLHPNYSLGGKTVLWDEATRSLRFRIICKGHTISMTLLLYGIDEFVKFAPEDAKDFARGWDMFINIGCGIVLKPETKAWFLDNVLPPTTDAHGMFGDHDLRTYGVSVSEGGTCEEEWVVRVGFNESDPRRTYLLVSDMTKIFGKGQDKE